MEKTLQNGLKIICNILNNEQKEIFQLLNARLSHNQESTLKCNTLQLRQGCKNAYVDYSDYFWITITGAHSTYRITLFYTDANTENGNFRTQLGKIQFWKDIHYTDEDSIGSPNYKSPDGHWSLYSENSHDPHLKIGENGYSAQAVIDKFMAFLKENNETI